ncbi:metallophosphoesterase family protein [Nocardioides marmoraquaticus]
MAVLADTHAPRFWKGCPPGVAEHLRGVDLVLHAGDVCRADVLDELATYAPVLVVLGNNDGADVAAWAGAGPAGVPEVLETELAGVQVAMLHDSGPAKGRGPRLRRRFPDADLVVFGHSHIPWDETTDGQRALNPGSPTDKRRQPRPTMALLELADGRVVTAEVVPVA